MTINDTDPEDIIARLRKRGTSLAALAREHGGSSQALSAALRLPTLPKWEKVIADALGEDPRHLWPSRFAKRAAKAAARAKLSAEIAAARARPRRLGRPPIQKTLAAAAAVAGPTR